MDTRHLIAQFGRIGARLQVRSAPEDRRVRVLGFALDVRGDRRGEFFELIAPQDRGFRVLALDAKDRHLLLEAEADSERFLCGHDERHWFVAGVSNRVSSVRAAKESLRPEIVSRSLEDHGVRPKDRDRRRNKGFVRQGEWFFIPVGRLAVKEKLILRNEPLVRGRGKPHMAEELYREGGQTVHVCPKYPNGVTPKEYAELIAARPDLRRLNWRVMSRNPRAYVRGRIRHPDHKTVLLRVWHRVVPNQERMSQNMAFLD